MPYFISKEKIEKLKTDLNQLIHEKRKEVISRIAKAREYGDISENSEYDMAREQQSFVEGRILQIQAILKDSKVLETPSRKDEVSLGSRVVVEVDGEKDEFIIVSSIEANPLEGKISNESPVGKALIGSKVGNTVTANSTLKTLYKVLEIK